MLRWLCFSIFYLRFPVSFCALCLSKVYHWIINQLSCLILNDLLCQHNIHFYAYLSIYLCVSFLTYFCFVSFAFFSCLLVLCNLLLKIYLHIQKLPMSYRVIISYFVYFLSAFVFLFCVLEICLIWTVINFKLLLFRLWCVYKYYCFPFGVFFMSKNSFLSFLAFSLFLQILLLPRFCFLCIYKYFCFLFGIFFVSRNISVSSLMFSLFLNYFCFLFGVFFVSKSSFQSSLFRTCVL